MALYWGKKNMVSADLSKSRGGLMKLTRSTMLWVVLILIAVDITIKVFVRPERAALDDNPRLVAMKKFLSGTDHPHVVLLGSSLTFAASYFWDVEFSKRLPAVGKIDSVSSLRAVYFEHVLNEQLKKEFTVANLSFPGGMALDARIILSKLLEKGKVPGLVIYEIAPRDLVDNLAPVGGGALGTESVLEDQPRAFMSIGHVDPEYLVKAMMSTINQSTPVIAWQRKLARLGKDPSWQAVRDLCIGEFWRFYEVKPELRLWLTELACDFLKRQASLYASVHRAQSSAVCADDTLFRQDLRNYAARYNPPNYRQLKQQSVELRRIAELCAARGIQFVMVNMPITAQNKAILDKQLRKKYLQTLTDLAQSR
ncbi:MAG: hypothetical protein HY711_10475, partial [Candidatus Melainabacteria bacterium]|nr:hypothetical protein [Candidatus Melainabacteria bacterium]